MSDRTLPEVNPGVGSRVFALGAVYFFSLAGVQVWTYIPRYFTAIGLSGAAIGTIFAAKSIAQSVVSPGWASVADRFGATRKIVIFLCLAGVVAIAALPWTASFAVILMIMIVYASTSGATMPLVDALTLDQVGSRRYGVIRAWGSVGFGVLAIAAALGGLFTTHEGLARLAPAALILLSFFAFLSSLALARGRVEVKTPDFKRAFGLLNRRALWIVFLIAALHWASQAPYNLFIVFLCEERGFSAWVPGLAVAIGVTAEIFALANGPRLLRALTPARLLLLSVGTTAIRWFFSGVVTDPLLLLVIQCLHGLTFGAFLVAMMAIIAREVAPEIRATGQAVFYIVVFGLGGALGNALSGLVLDHYTAATLFRLSAGLELVLFVVGLMMLPIIEPKISTRH
ncbi:MAG: MFS transporter [Bradymonadaceae bacterium]